MQWDILERGGVRNRSNIGSKKTEEMKVVDLSIHSSDANSSGSSAIDPVGSGKIGAVPNIITCGVSSD